MPPVSIAALRNRIDRLEREAQKTVGAGVLAAQLFDHEGNAIPMKIFDEDVYPAHLVSAVVRVISIPRYHYLTGETKRVPAPARVNNIASNLFDYAQTGTGDDPQNEMFEGVENVMIEVPVLEEKCDYVDGFAVYNSGDPYNDPKSSDASGTSPPETMDVSDFGEEKKLDELFADPRFSEADKTDIRAHAYPVALAESYIALFDKGHRGRPGKSPEPKEKRRGLVSPFSEAIKQQDIRSIGVQPDPIN